MRCLTKYITGLIGILLLVTTLHAESLYECYFQGKWTTYHENEAKRMTLLGANCRQMHPVEHVTCAMNGVRLDYSKEEAEKLLYQYPQAHCEMNNLLYLSTRSQTYSHPLALIDQVIVYFPVGSASLTSQARSKLYTFAQRHRNMGYLFSITGYASAPGRASRNHIISLNRAGAVRNALLNAGLNENNILSVDALGEASLRYNTPYEMRLNRAVVVKAYGEGH